ncbi:HAD family hydrolase [Microbacterium sp. NC79]|uniref:HAD family hydrolase n=1 Tax=Microbacterium sp. NC79 TaxID=2851009 RepID=UPI001C2CB7E7|nr:HAD family hydrolase [Microbacterium sp. NC79]MBV0896113.1 HAD family hydrolase [Microbacterium sp. NC79]
MTPSIVFDFDGTLALGHGPVIAFARAIADQAGPDYLARVDESLAAYDAGSTEYRDGYDIVTQFAKADGVSAEALQVAYNVSRESLGTDAGSVGTMDDLAGFLKTVGTSARLVLATNAPETGVDRVLDAWGVTDLFDEKHFTVGKPAGLGGLVSRLLADGPVLSIGDIAINDLLPAQELGADTALVGATAQTSPINTTMRGASLAALRSDIEAWVASAAAGTTPAA